MTEHKHIGKIVGALMAAAVAFCLIVTLFADRFVAVSGSSAATMEYKSTLFDTSEIMTVNIIMDEDQWQELLDNAISEKYYACDVEINGETISNVGIRTKGNTSLSSIANDPDTDRYSFKIKFDKYVDGQTCMGLDKLVLNNNFADATNRKEALVYDMFQYLGADASLYHYAKISVNGEYWGTYLALEAVEDSFKLRNYGVSDGKLYKPETMGMGNDQKEDGINSDMSDRNVDTDADTNADTNVDSNTNIFGSEEVDLARDNNPMDRPERPQGDFDQADMDEKFKDPQGDPGDFGGFDNRNGGADLNYTDDDTDSYSTIWDGADGKVTDSDKERVVTAIKNINEGTDLTTYLDVDNILKYMAVHEFVVNLDSLSGNMAHNYYLYENDGQLNIIPWDYNLSFGGMMNGGMGGGPGRESTESSGATSMINDPIDTPFDGTDFFDALLENEEYLAQYHEYLRQLAEEYVQGGRLQEVWERLDAQTDELIETDPTAFYTAAEYEEAKETLWTVLQLRAESVLGQLDGTIPSTDDGQQNAQDTLIDGSAIDLSVMGEFNH
jgi:spore coat protein CotH